MGITLGLLHFHTVDHSDDPFHQHRCVGLRRLGDQTLISRMIGRLNDSEQVDVVGIVLPTDASSRRALRECLPRHLRLWEGTSDAVADTRRALSESNATSVVLVGIEQPFFDILLLDQLVTHGRYSTADFLFYGDGDKIAPSENGLVAHWFSSAAIQVADENAGDTERYSAAAYVLANRDQFNVECLPLPDDLDPPNLRLRIDNAEDWEHAHMIEEALEEDSSWRDIAGLLRHQPQLQQRMARLNQAERTPRRPHVASQQRRQANHARNQSSGEH